ncbi:unnamed protein product [Amoebophrya sp. A120]|nr:unnamed protein product [Amoebophrya sp. A120]|eukprot:GSA120T00007095001.1
MMMELDNENNVGDRPWSTPFGDDFGERVEQEEQLPLAPRNKKADPAAESTISTDTRTTINTDTRMQGQLQGSQRPSTATGRSGEDTGCSCLPAAAGSETIRAATQGGYTTPKKNHDWGQHVTAQNFFHYLVMISLRGRDLYDDTFQVPSPCASPRENNLITSTQGAEDGQRTTMNPHSGSSQSRLIDQNAPRSCRSSAPRRNPVNQHDLKPVINAIREIGVSPLCGQPDQLVACAALGNILENKHLLGKRHSTSTCYKKFDTIQHRDGLLNGSSNDRPFSGTILPLNSGDGRDVNTYKEKSGPGHTSGAGLSDDIEMVFDRDTAPQESRSPNHQHFIYDRADGARRPSPCSTSACSSLRAKLARTTASAASPRTMIREHMIRNTKEEQTVEVLDDENNNPSRDCINSDVSESAVHVLIDFLLCAPHLKVREHAAKALAKAKTCVPLVVSALQASCRKGDKLCETVRESLCELAVQAHSDDALDCLLSTVNCCFHCGGSRNCRADNSNMRCWADSETGRFTMIEALGRLGDEEDCSTSTTPERIVEQVDLSQQQDVQRQVAVQPMTSAGETAERKKLSTEQPGRAVPTLSRPQKKPHKSLLSRHPQVVPFLQHLSVRDADRNPLIQRAARKALANLAIKGCIASLDALVQLLTEQKPRFEIATRVGAVRNLGRFLRETSKSSEQTGEKQFSGTSSRSSQHCVSGGFTAATHDIKGASTTTSRFKDQVSRLDEDFDCVGKSRNSKTLVRNQILRAMQEVVDDVTDDAQVQEAANEVLDEFHAKDIFDPKTLPGWPV